MKRTAGGYTFCTFFDRHYLSRGLALYRSLREQCESFTLWVLCMDTVTETILGRMALEGVRLVSLTDFERGDGALLAAKGGRSAKEYCWTVTPSLPLYVLRECPGLDTIAYLDADLFFFGSPHVIHEELGDGSILIVPHRYAPAYAFHEQTAGTYNVGMLIFRNDAAGTECLRWWRERCNEWCFARIEDGKLGDQKYLDDWPARFQRVVVATNKGVGLGPWNLPRYQIGSAGGRLMADEVPVIFYHFQRVVPRRDWILEVSVGYTIRATDIRLIYRPYARALKRATEAIRRVAPGFNGGVSKLSLPRILKRAALGRLCFAWR